MRTQKRQEGAVLFIALIALLSLSYIALRQFRAVDESSLLAGNLTYRVKSAQGADRGIQVAANWLFDPANKGKLLAPHPGDRYFPQPPSTDPDWTVDATWAPGTPVVDEVGQKIDFLIHRLCRNTGPVEGNECIEGVPTSVAGGSTHRNDGAAAYSKPQIQYRVTVRVRGPRGTVAIVQSMLLGPRG